MYEMSQQHPVWVAENHVKPCNSVRVVFKSNLEALQVNALICKKHIERSTYKNLRRAESSRKLI